MIDKILDDLLCLDPYSLSFQEKEKLFLNKLGVLCKFHYTHCKEYKKILDILGKNSFNFTSLYDLPFLPVSLFKRISLKSVTDDEIVKIPTSSGTSGQSVSRIYLDAMNATNQTKVLSSIISSFIGIKRLPLILLDTNMLKKDRTMYSARGAGVIGFSVFGRDTIFALDENMDIDIEKIIKFLKENKEHNILMFGYTYMIWQFIIKALEKKKEKLNIKSGFLFHSGGWKKLQHEAVCASEFNARAKAVLGDVKIHNYYGMAEQLGSIFVECEAGHLHVSNFSDIIIRDPIDFSILKNGEKGAIELISLLPTSYPGNSLLTEDEGVVLGQDDCKCGKKGKYFKILGRIKNAEIRGCGDTYEKH